MTPSPGKESAMTSREHHGNRVTMSTMSTARVGKAVEHLVAASCILISNAELNVSTSFVDDEGVDLVFHRRGGVATLAVQVKSRSSDASTLRNRRFRADVSRKTFSPRADLYVLFVVIDRATAQFGPVWFVPSIDFAEKSTIAAKTSLRFSANSGQEARDRWVPFRMSFSELPIAILKKLGTLEADRQPPQ